MSMTLAIAAPSFSAPSETFIRAHVRTLAPGATVLVCDDGDGAEAFQCPVLSDLEPFPPPHAFLERVTNGLRFRWRHRIDPALDGAAEQRVRAFLQYHRPRAVLAEKGPTACRLRLACRRADVPLFAHFHGYDATTLAAQPFWRRQYRKLFADAAGVIVPSRFLADRLRALGAPQDRLHVTPCGVDPSEFAAPCRGENRILAVGRLVDKKAPHITIRAFAKARRTLPQITLEMIGDGPLRGMCEQTAAEYGVRDAVEFHGTCSPAFVRARLANATIFVQHSVEDAQGDTEGLPVGILEAMAARQPVVSTWHAGIPEAVADGETGILVPEHDVDGMAEAMIALLRDPDRAARMGEAGRARVLAHFTHDHTARRLRTIMGLESLEDRKLKNTQTRLC